MAIKTKAMRLSFISSLQRPQPGDDLASLPSVFLFASMCLPSRLLQRDARENQFVLLVCHLQDMMSHILDRRSA